MPEPLDRFGRGAVLVGATATLALAWALIGCRAQPPQPARHLVILTLDTLRADHVGAYGGTVATPALDALAQRGALFEQAMAHVPLTKPSHWSLFSGLLPLRTGVRDNLTPQPASELPLLAEILESRGFATGAFISAAVIDRSSGLGRGFKTFNDHFAGTGSGLLNEAQRRGDATLAEATTWLEQVKDAERFFLWVHLYDPHDPYDAPAPFGAQYPDRPYAGEVAFTDDLVGRLERTLTKLDIAAETLLIAASDHGEGLGDHGETLHGFLAYQSTLHVPLLVAGPGIAPGRRIPEPVGLVDVLPTALELLGVELPADLDGRSLAKRLLGGPELEQETVYAESLVPQLHFGWSDLRVARAGNYKLILAPRPELYDLRSDPAELQNLIAEARPQARLLIDQLALLRQKEVTSDETGAPLPPEQLAKLRALGYLGSTERATTRDPGADPKDKIADFRLANELIRGALEDLAPRPADAVAKLERLLDRGIESAEIHLALARGYLALRQFARAAEAAQDSVTRAPLGRDAWLILAEARLQLNDRAGGLKAFNDAFEFLPRDGTLFREYGQVLKRLGELKQAHDAFAAATRWAPEDGLAWALHGEALRDRGAIAEGIVALEKSVALAPDRASFWNVLGMTLGGAGRLADAERAFGKALELEPRNPLVIFNLGLALERQGRAEEAQRRFAETLELAPNFAPAKAKIGAS